MMHVARAVAQLSPMRHRVGACVVRGGRVLGVGHNKPGSTKMSKSRWSRHAEVQAIILAGDVRGSTLFVYRALRDGSAGLARPCHDCQEVIDAAGIRKVVFSAPVVG